MKYRQRALYYDAVAWLAAAAIAALSAYLTWKQRQEGYEMTKASVSNIAGVLAAQVENSLDQANALLVSVGQRYAVAASESEKDLEKLTEQFRREVPNYPLVNRIVVFNSGGQEIVNTGVPRRSAPAIHVSDRDYFQRARAGEKRLIFSGPLQSRLTGEWTLILAHRIESGSGEFAGVSIAIVPVQAIGNTFERVGLGPSGSVNMRTADLAEVVRYPALTGPNREVGNRNVSSKIQQLMRAEPDQDRYAYKTVAPIDGMERIYAYRKFDHSPYWLSVGRATADFDTSWQRTAILLTLLSLAMAALLQWGARRLKRQYHDLEERVAQRTVELIASESNFRTLVEFAPDAIIVIDEQGIIGQCNPAAELLFGHPRDELLGRNVGLLMAGPNRENHDSYIARYLATGQASVIGFGRDVEALRKDGSMVPIQLRVGEQRLANGSRRFIGFVRDLSERVQAENILRERQALLNNVIETSKDGFLVVDLHGRLLEVNDAYCRQSGYARHQLLTMSVRDLEAIESQAQTEAHIANIMRDGSDIFETQHRRQDGSVWPMEASVTYSADQGGRLIAFCRDISERTQSAAELAEAHQKLLANQFAMDSVGIGISWSDAETGRFLYVNQNFAQLLGYSTDEMLQLSVPDVAPDCPLETYRRIGETIRQAGKFKSEGSHVTRDGRRIPTEIALYFQQGYGNLPPHHIAFITDISRRKEADQALIKAEVAEAAARAKGMFLANMSHEIRTPLNAILGMANIGARDSTQAANKAAFERIRESGAHLLGIVNDVLDFSKLEAGKFSIESRPFRMATVLASVRSFVSAMVQQKGLDLRIEYGTDSPEWLLGDAQRIQQILANLLSNAVKFTSHGEVRLSLEREGETTRFSLTDTGIGIRPDQLARLFSPFEQADSSTTRNYGGTGLGLAISQRLANLMDGDIEVQSEEGKGSTFILSLPLPASPIPEELSHTAPLEASALKGYSILAAEDIDINRFILEDLLQEAGANVLLVENGQEAVEAVAAEPARFDVVLMDIQMPVMDGYEATRRIKAMHAALPVLGLTAHALAEERQKCFAAGMADHLTKPIHAQALIAAIQKFAGGPVVPGNTGSMAQRQQAANAVPKPSGESEAGSAEIDMEALLRQFRGKREVVAKLFKVALDGERQRPAQLRAAAVQFEAGQTHELAVLAHTVKGIAANLHATSVMKLAESVETAAECGQANAASLARALAEHMEALFDELSARLEKNRWN